MQKYVIGIEYNAPGFKPVSGYLYVRRGRKYVEIAESHGNDRKAVVLNLARKIIDEAVADA